ncbi:MAG: hypothetical protein BAJALOKI1v1_480011 [Promethearchaeota archaeon]|nr:MAG: hypothetical protein BAJALOKI1v1_480011 [Candidatus Lokiarchaeota archaeon]
MSESRITDSKSSIKKMLMLVEEINTINTETIPKLTDQPNNILKALESFEVDKKSKKDNIEANKNEISSLKEKISKNERTIAKLKEEIDELTNKKNEFIKKIEDVQNNIKELQAEIASKNEEFEARKQRLKELEETITNLKIEKDKTEDDLKKLEEDLENKFLEKKHYVDNYESRIKAMKILIRANYIQTGQVKLIKSLQKDATLDLNHILMAIDLKEDKARQILRKMVENNGPLVFDEQAGTVTLQEEVDFDK